MARRTLYLESFAGIAGDMFTAAFLDAGLVEPALIEAVPGALGRPDVKVEIKDVQRASARFTHVSVKAPGGQVESPGTPTGGDGHNGHSHDHSHNHSSGHGHAHGHSHSHSRGHHHYHYPALVQELQESALEPEAKAFALEVFRLLAEAEADSHGVPVEKVAFHEVGAVDSVVDVAMAGVCVSTVGADRILASPIKLGRGTIEIQHGSYPVPPPASARLAVGMPIDPVPSAIEWDDIELSTPTGLAILKALNPRFVLGWPSGTLRAQGSGSGTLDLGAYPNVFRVALLEEEGRQGPEALGEDEPGRKPEDLPYETDRVVELRCNLDDQTGERMGWLLEKAVEKGALDAWIAPVLGKKGRPAHILSALVDADQRNDLADFLLRTSGTFGVRYSSWDRFKLLREFETRETEEGPVTFKVGRTTDGEWLTEKPEYEELKKIWEKDPGFEP